MTIHSFDDLVAIDEELAGLFLRPDQAVNWVYAVKNGIKEWIGKHNKQYWEIVRFVSQERGILGKLRRDGRTVKLKREDFARVVLKFCPNAFVEGESVSALKSSMEHYEYMNDLRNVDRMPSGRFVCIHIREVEALLDRQPVVVTQEEKYKPTLEDLVATYLRREVNERANQFPRSKVRIRPQYAGISPAISVETYKSEQFLKERRPSSIEAYEFVDGVLQKSKFYELAGQYADKRVKLYIVSSAGLLPDVRAMAADRNIGYVLLNPNAVMTSDSYVLPRSIEDYTKWRHDLDVLEGTRPMTTPLLIWDGARLTSSLTDVLSENGVAVKRQRLLYIPFVPEEEIEQRANALTAADVERMAQKFQRSAILDADFSLDPFAYADSCGLSHHEEDMEADYQLGLLDVEKSLVTLNSAGTVNASRFRFTMAHELGHFLLHAPLFKKQGVVSVGESEDTLSISRSDSRRLEYQANKFASCLLMPKDLVVPLYVYFFNRYVSQRFGDDFHALYYNPKQRETWFSYNSIVGNMANLLGVSLSALHFRLLSLGLLKTPD